MEDKLVLAQVVHLIGAADWHNVSASLMRMSTGRGKQIVLTPAECENIWGHLMRQGGVNLHDPSTQERIRAPQAPENLDLVKRLYMYRLTELHHQILEKERAFQQLSNELNEIRSGAWDEKLTPKKPGPEPATFAPAATASSSSSQLSSVDSPAHTPAGATDAQRGKDDMDIDEVDATATQQDGTGLKLDGQKPEPPDDESPVADEDTGQKSKNKRRVKEGDEEEDAEGEDEDEEKEVERARSTRELRSNKKIPVLEPLKIPQASTSARQGKGHKASDSTSQPSARGRRRGGPESAKPPHSPATASVAETFESVATPAATDENASVADEGGRRRSTREHRRKTSEMDVDPAPLQSKRIRDRSTTVEDEPMTPALPSGSGRFSNPKLKQSMIRIASLLSSNKHAEIFRRPVTKKEAPDYAQAVQRPTDLTAIQRAIKAGQIASWDELERELRKMLANCCVYNRPGTGAYETAKLMLAEVEQMLEVAREGAGDGK